MRIFIFTLILISYNLVFSQDYMPVRLNDTTFFATESNQIYGIRIDSSKNIGNQIIFELNRSWNQSDYSCIRPNGPSYLGTHFVKESNSVYNFFNDSNQTIRLEPLTQLNSTWKMYNFPDGKYILATLIKVSEDIFLGLTDTVKYFRMNLFDKDGNLISNDLNGKEFSISKNYGFIKMFDMRSFPKSIHIATLSGRTNPSTGQTYLTDFDINNYEEGDEFHYRVNSSRQGGTYPYEINIQHIYKILKKQYITNYDTVDYLIERLTLTQEKTWQNGFEEDTSNIYHLSYHIIFNFNRKHYLPYEPILSIPKTDIFDRLYAQGCGYIIKPDLNNRRILFPATEYMEYSDSNNCWSVISEVKTQYVYLEGCGVFTSQYIKYSDMTSVEDRLVYYKKGNETWGEPLTITDIKENLLSQNLQIFPNPVSNNGILSISYDKPIKNIKIIDLLGRTRIEQNVNSSFDLKLNIGNLEKGIYFLIVKDSSDNLHSLKLIVD